MNISTTVISGAISALIVIFTVSANIIEPKKIDSIEYTIEIEAGFFVKLVKVFFISHIIFYTDVLLE